ncbi:ABC transporter G member 20 [Dionaea muscipula]
MADEIINSRLKQTMHQKGHSQSHSGKSSTVVLPKLGELMEWVEHTGGRDDGSVPVDEYSAHHHHQVRKLKIVSSSSSSCPFVLSFNNLTYSVKIRQSPILCGSHHLQKVLLDDISGEAREGEIMAVMGASGSGKSTLIDALADRISKERLKGSVTLNGRVLEPKLLKAISAYVMQDDLLFPMLTVEETLMFSAEFRLPRTLFSKSMKKARVEAVIDQLGLRDAADTVIGDEGHRGVSGGERRRVSIGMDMIHDPIVLFLDEPTSGLDSTSAFMVVKVLQRIAHSGSIVIMSIHQPSYRILSLFDRLIILSRGQTVYSSSPDNLPGFFAEFGHPIPEREDRSEFALDLIRQLELDSTEALVEFSRLWQERTQSPPPPPPPMEILEAAADDDDDDDSELYSNPLWVEVYVIGKRSLLNARRMPELFRTRFVGILLTGVVLSTVFLSIDESPKGAEERISFFAAAISTMYFTCGEAMPVFLQERYIFMRETSFNAYRRTSYVLSQTLIAIPSLLVLAITFAAATFWTTRLSGGLSGFLVYFLFIFAALWAGHSFVTFLSGVVSQVIIGYIVVVALLSYFALFGGFFITRDRIPGYWIWFHYLSLAKYPYDGVLLNEFRAGPPARCYLRGLQIFDGTPLEAMPEAAKVKELGIMSSALGIMNLTVDSCLVTGADILKQQGITQLGMWSCFWITVAWGFLFRILFYFALLFGSKNKRS